MTKINILSPLLADMIAAGEVVERPASVIKELAENSFDAGAKKLTIEFRNGGATYIRITDDGCGMSPEDAGIAFMRHATSKLHDEKGLEAIGTMGFRGEALAAISAVSRIELTTREKGAAEGVRVTVQAGDIVEMTPCGCPEGTTITVRDLFYNTPARLKFLKSDRSEATACTAAALRCALGRPEVSVKCIKDGEEVFFTPGDGKAESAVYSLLGRDIASSMLPCSGDGDSIEVKGFVSSPALSRGNRSMQYFFCNGRFIKSALLQSAVEQAYKNTLLTGRYPACTLFITLKTSAVDVNVHPAKTEVRFSDEKKVFDIVYQTVKASLESEEKPLELKISESTQRVVSSPERGFFRSMSAQSYRESLKPETAPVQPRRESFSQNIRPIVNRPLTKPVSHSENVEKTVESVEKITALTHRVIGECLNTYILVEDGDELLLIDKHAAHERMIFDRLKSQGRQIMSQTLIAPVIIKPTPEDMELLEQNASLLNELGFEIEQYGENDCAIRALPDDMDVSEARAAVEEICEKLRRGDKPDAASARDEVLHTVACKAAIKAGRRHDIRELERIADAVCAGEVKYCPHGRPVSVRLSKNELDKFFSRIV